MGTPWLRPGVDRQMEACSSSSCKGSISVRVQTLPCRVHSLDTATLGQCRRMGKAKARFPLTTETARNPCHAGQKFQRVIELRCLGQQGGADWDRAQLGEIPHVTYWCQGPAPAVKPCLAVATWACLSLLSTKEAPSTWVALQWASQPLPVTVRALRAGLRMGTALDTVRALQNKASFL